MAGLKTLTSDFGSIIYNGYTFTPLRQVRVRMVPVYDAADRSVIALDIVFNVHAIIYAQPGGANHEADVASCQSKMDTVMLALSEPGKRLQVSGIGLSSGFDTVTHNDLNNGPHPRLIGPLVPVGADIAWEIEWEVVYRRVPYCVQNDPTGGAIIAFNYDVFYVVNEEGLVQRTLSGYVEVFQKRVGKSITPIDDVLAKIKFRKLPFMRRVSFQRRINSSRTRIEFSVVDEEMVDEAYPDGMIHADAELSIENNPPGFMQWSAALSVTLTTAPGVKRSLAADKFFIMLFDAAKKANDAAKSAGGVVIPERLRISVPKFGRRSRFFASWRMAACLHDVLAKMGMWDMVPGTSFASWSKSLEDLGIGSYTGVSGVGMQDYETVIDLCNGVPEQIVVGSQFGSRKDIFGTAKQKLLCPEVTKERSYMYYDNRIRGVQQQNAIIHKIMQFFSSPSSASSDAGSSSLFPTPQTGVRDHVVQTSGQSDNYVIMQGRALRIKYSPEVPHLTKVVGKNVQELARNVDTKTVAGYFDCPMISTRWAILYRVEGQIYGVAPPNNKQMCFTTGEDDGRKS